MRIRLTVLRGFINRIHSLINIIDEEPVHQYFSMPTPTIEKLAKIFRINQDTLKTENQNEKPSAIVKEFCLTTSAHGLAGIARSRNFFHCLFWTIPTLAFLGIMIFLITLSIIEYRGYPTQTSVEIISKWPLAFPAVTICNRAGIRSDKIMKPFLNFTNATEFSPELVLKLFVFLRDLDVASNSSDDYFFSLNNMLISCTFNGFNCTENNFTELTVRQYGHCYTFNAKLKSVPNGGIRYISDNGGTGELKMEFYVHRHQYVPLVQRGEGMVAVLHDNDRIPSFSSSAMLLGTQQHHRWNYRNRAFSFLPEPFSKCKSKSNLAMQTLFDQYQAIEYGYSIGVCFDICLQTYIFDTCGCLSPDLWHIRSIVLPGTSTVIKGQMCAYENNCWMDKSKEFVFNLTIWETYCQDCDEECSYTEFVMKTSSMPVTLDYDLLRIKEFVEQSNVSLPENWSEIYATEIPKSYVSFEIITETTRVETYTQQQSINLGELISNVGGQTGLWIGISFLSLFEVIEVIFHLLRINYQKLKQQFHQYRQRRDLIRVQL